MITNVDVESNQERFKNTGGIGLYKINYEMDVKGRTEGEPYLVGIIAYTSEEAVKTLTDFCAKRVKGFKGAKIQELAFEGNCHAMSDKVKNAILKGAKADGLVIDKKEHDEIISKLEKELSKKATKKSIIPKD
jgi:hypothetical protein